MNRWENKTNRPEYASRDRDADSHPSEGSDMLADRSINAMTLAGSVCSPSRMQRGSNSKNTITKNAQVRRETNNVFWRPVIEGVV